MALTIKNVASETPDIDTSEVEGLKTETKPITEIVIKNTELTLHGVRRLCAPYGTVLDVRKLGQTNAILIKFSSESEAGLAIEQLNGKLGFQYYPAFARPREPKPTTVTTFDAEENWDNQYSIKKRFTLAFALPLGVNFPPKEILETSSAYALDASKEQLKRIDPNRFFCITSVEPQQTVHIYDVNNRRQKIDAHLKAYEKNPQEVRNLESLGNGTYGIRLLSDKTREKFDFQQSCSYCKKLGFLRCTKCTWNFCSLEHLNLDRKHRQQCEAKDVSPVMEENRVLHFVREELPKNEEICITAVLNHRCVYVRSLGKQANIEYGEMQSKMALAGLEGVVLASAAKPGDVLLAKYEPLDIYGRVLVVSVTELRAKCVYLDYGAVQQIPFSALKRCTNDDLSKLNKVFIYKILLNDITNEHGHIEGALEYLRQLWCKKQPLKLTYTLEATNMVGAELYTTMSKVHVNKKINSLITIPVVDAHQQAHICYDDLPKRHLPVDGSETQIMILNRTSVKLDYRVTCIAQADLPYLRELQTKLQHYGKKVNNFTEYYTPRLNELCLVRCGEKWYRGVCHETCGDGKPTIFLCDFGCMVMIQLTDIRKIPPSLATEVCTIDARIHGLKEAKESGLEIDFGFLDIYLPENELLLVKVSEEKEFDDLISKDDNTMITVLEFPDLEHFLLNRSMRLEDKRQSGTPQKD